MHDDRAAVGVYALFVVIGATYLVLALYFPVAYIWATYEDLVGEWSQFWCFVTALVFSTRLAIVKSRYRWFFALLAASCFYVSMEEISWGQRVFSFGTPEFFQQHNLQKEANLHNFLTGPIGTPLKRGIEYAMACGMVAYGAVYPFVNRWGWSPATRLARLGVAPPPVYLWPFFVAAAFFELGPLHFNEAEIAEVLVSLALAIMTMAYWHDYRSRRAKKGGRGDKRVPPSLVKSLGRMVLVVLLLAGGSTYAFYASPESRERIDNRIGNGLEKFASRYQRYGRWQTSARLYLMVLESEPGRCSVLRKLARCYEEVEDTTTARTYLKRAIALDLGRLKERPDSVSLNVSLARTYRQMGETAGSDYHLDRALRIARGRVAQRPTSAGAAYWLGKCYEVQGHDQSALAEYRRAMELRPEQVKYKKAYYRLAGSVDEEEE